ncbi:MAG: hypothetical protein ICV84_21335 [Flavisolibacter sp.]|nr:hypothetical protein [Flavisolibacter sp.]
MNIHFSHIIKAGERNREFNLRKVSSGSAMVYHIDVPDDKGNRVFFTMRQNKEGEWRMVEQVLPSWLYDAEAAIGEAIKQKEHQTSYR